jgi:cytochrome c peroxidase
MKRSQRLQFCVVAAAALAGACKKTEAPAPEGDRGAATGAASARATTAELDPKSLGIFGALPADFASKTNPGTEDKVALGRMLYFENRISKGHDTSCNTCHDLKAYGADGRQFSVGHKKQLGARNSPSVYNAAGHFVQFWDGRAADVEEQAKGPVLNPIEMAMPGEELVVETLSSMPEYVAAFKRAFPGEANPVTLANFAKAVGAFERNLVTPGRFDKFLAGEAGALTAAEKAGLKTFVETGCVACHNGPLVGGQIYQKLGLVRPWPDAQDLGRFRVTKQDGDRMMFKVPSLRNVAMTAPYFHDGATKTLEEAVQKMASHQLGRDLPAGDVASIVTFLKALTGDVPADYIRPPELPKSTAKTPKPGGE